MTDKHAMIDLDQIVSREWGALYGHTTKTHRESTEWKLARHAVRAALIAAADVAERIDKMSTREVAHTFGLPETNILHIAHHGNRRGFVIGTVLREAAGEE